MRAMLVEKPRIIVACNTATKNDKAFMERLTCRPQG